MISYCKLKNMIELHDNIIFGKVINQIDDIYIYDYFENHVISIVGIAVICNNLEAFTLIINHKSMVNRHFNGEFDFRFTQQCFDKFYKRRV